MTEQNNVKPSSITLKHLAILLTSLAETASSATAQIKRKIPGYLSHMGDPNLIVCPQREQIHTALSMYALSDEQPLPRNDEILYCTMQTTAEEVENFLRIAFKSSSNKIYTLINIQDLSYQIAEKIDAFLQLSPANATKTENFVLVLICSQEKQFQSILVSLYSRNKVKPVLLSVENLEAYLNKKLYRKKDRNFALSNFDPDFSNVRVLISRRSGNGKSLYVQELMKQIEYQGAKINDTFNYICIRIKSTNLQMDTEIEKLFEFNSSIDSSKPTLYHIDVAYEVFFNLDQYLFSLVILNYLKHSNGLVWRRNITKDLYMIEITPPLVIQGEKLMAIHSMINFLPKIEFRTPSKHLYDLNNGCVIAQPNLFGLVFKSEMYQRSCFYIKLINEYREKRAKRDAAACSSGGCITGNQYKTIDYKNKLDEIDELLTKKYEESQSLSELECLNVIMNHSGLTDPNWHEIKNYCCFLNSNLVLIDKSEFVKSVAGLRGLILQLILLMTNDFGLSSLKMMSNVNNRDILAPQKADKNSSSPPSLLRSYSSKNQQFLRRQESINIFETNSDLVQVTFDCFELAEERRWENLIHPYIMVNVDLSITFIGTYLDRTKKEFFNPNTRMPCSDVGGFSLPRISSDLFLDLLRQNVPMFDNFNLHIKERKHMTLCKVMGLDCRGTLAVDPDPNYELTLDNCLKMIAIYLRFYCNIPVVIMGETGCGKTSLIRYLSLILRRDFERNLVHVKIHGGTTAEDIRQRLEEAEALSVKNFYQYYRDEIDAKPKEPVKTSHSIITALLFLDEANTTEYVGLVKEVMCDLTLNGRKIDLEHGLKIVAAVNPYRKHSETMIEKLENAGLGFYMPSSETKEKFGHIPIRHLVYRVQQLPTSLMPLVWDYGQLEKNVERNYIENMVKKVYNIIFFILKAFFRK